MFHDPAVPQTVRVWIPAGQADLSAVADSGWRTWPSLTTRTLVLVAFADRRAAMQAARQQHAQPDGVGYVAAAEVRREYLESVAAVAGGWVIPAGGDEFNANVVGAIQEVVEFCGAVSDQEFEDSEAVLGFAFPPAWREILQRPSWFRRGWLESDMFLELLLPHESVGVHQAWDMSLPQHPGIAIIGGDGAREMLCLDLREDPAPVMLVEATSEGWDDNPRQSDDVATFMDQVENGTFVFHW